MDKSYRIKTNIGAGAEKMINVNLKQDVDLYEILSLKLSQEKLYEAHSANYGVIVGRVLANDAFGVPNARVSVFIPLSDDDAERTGISSIYPFNAVTDYDSNNIRYNLLSSKKEFPCHANVGTFPSKRLVLDDDTMLEIYDKYYRYTTVTNKAGDYMIFGVPVGQQVLHVDVDLSDIGLLSQTPRDMVYKGYPIDMFESPVKFKKSTNLADLVQIHSENVAVEVYPFWGDETVREVAITRNDINLQYKFEPTCVFLGSILTDNGMNAIGHNCVPDEKMGEASQLTTTEGTIEMIRKTIDGKVEEFPIKGNNLIDGNGVFCYQIPMNLDYVGMDEYGNIVPTNNPLKGIPTRSRVRFRFTLKESGEGEMITHTARYLIPNNPPLYEGGEEESLKPQVETQYINTDIMYEFGTLTPENCFRDLYWNKVYSIKGYLPRLQASAYEKTREYIAIKGVNKREAQNNNIIPFNKINLNFKIATQYLLQRIYNKKYNDYNIFKRIWWLISSKSIPFNIDSILESIIDETDAVSLDFYNDWLNGCLYFPAWHWRSRKKTSYSEGDEVYESLMCECREKADEGGGKLNNSLEKLYLLNNCSLVYDTKDLQYTKNLNYDTIENSRTVSDNKAYNKTYFDTYFAGTYHAMTFGSKSFISGIIKKIINKDGGELYYYSFGNNLTENEETKDGYNLFEYARLFSTDIILLGSLNDCDIDGVPKMPYTYPATTATIPPVGRIKHDIDQGTEYGDDDMEENLYHQNGMNWGRYWQNYVISNNPEESDKYDVDNKEDILHTGLFFGLRRHVKHHGTNWLFTRHVETDDFITYSDPKTCINVERLCELGVINDKYVVQKLRENNVSEDDGIIEYTTGMILKKCLIDNNARALFATLNSGKLVAEKENNTTGYKTYNLVYFYPTNFDGRLETLAQSYLFPYGKKHDLINKDYVDFRLGNSAAYTKSTTRNGFGSGRIQGRTSDTEVYHNSHGNFGGAGVSTVTTDNDEIEFSYLNYEKQGHFYGVNIKGETDKTGDSTFPLKNGDFLKKLLGVGGESTQFKYAFPLYDNSFYFYFGLVRGNTAIDKFYSEFYGECPDNVKSGFATQVTGIEPAGTCEVNNGKIYYTIEEAEFPCTTELYRNNQLIFSENGISKTENEIVGLENDVYVLKVTDNTGAYTEETVTINPNKILLVWSVKNQIRTEYTTDKTCLDICGNNYYAELLFDKVTIEGKEYSITGLTKVTLPETSEKVGVYDLSLNSDEKKARIKLTPRGLPDEKTFDDLLCGTCNPPDSIIGNVMNFNQPVLLDVEVVQLCVSEEGTTESPNSDFYTISITDLKLPELFINDVPYKFMVGTKEDLLDTYNVKFHTGQPVESVTDTMISGWFGVHIPNTYDGIFNNPLTDETKEIWYKHTSEDSISEILNQKFTYMFNLSKGAYVTADGKNHTFNVRIAGGNDTQLLLRSGFPKYADFLEDNTERGGEFASFLTSSAGDITAHTASPNIVAENYRYVDASTKYPIDKNLIPNGPEPVITVRPYDFNPKYRDSINSAGNYFAGFTKNAGLLETSNDCFEGDDNFKSIPAKAHDLYRKDKTGVEVGMCPKAERNELKLAIYTKTEPPHRQINGHNDTAYTYTRTEFIDRRFDFDMFYITPCSVGEEKTWSMGRLSALTYNGIEMTYDESRNIIGTIGSGLEYEYNIDTGAINYKYDGPKRFYKSTLEYGSGKEIDLRSAYQYSERTPGTANVVNMIGNTVGTNGNFGLEGTTVKGYPSKRRLDFNGIPYGDYYKFTNVSCSYDISLDHREQSFAALASPGEIVSYTIETKSPVQLQVNDFERDYSTSNYNILYNWCIGSPCSRSQFTITAQEGSMRMNCSATNIKEIIFKIISTGTTNFASKIEDNIDENKFGVRLVGDKDDYERNITHINMLAIKTANSLDDVKTIITSNTIGNPIVLPTGNWLDTDSSFIDYSFSATNRTIQNGYKYIYILADRFYYSKYADSLLKKIRVLNASTMYDIGNFSLIYSGHKYVSKDLITIIPGENIKVNVEAEGDVPVPTPEGGEGGGGEQGGGGAGGTTNVPVGVSGTGEGSQDASGNAKDMHDLLFFTIDGGNSETSGINVNDIDDFCFKVTEPNQLTYYKRYDTDNEISGNTIVIKLPLRKNDNLIKCFGGLDNDGNCLPADAAIQLFIKMKNQLVYYLDFKLKGEIIAATQTDQEKLKVTISPYT